jgi:hypothetical protein
MKQTTKIVCSAAMSVRSLLPSSGRIMIVFIWMVLSLGMMSAVTGTTAAASADAVMMTSPNALTGEIVSCSG